MRYTPAVLILLWLAAVTGSGRAAESVHQRIRAQLDRIPAIDCHDHLRPFVTYAGAGLPAIWQGYARHIAPIAVQPSESATQWWTRVAPEFEPIRAMGYYRYMLPAFHDLYGVEFDTIDTAGIGALDARIRENYRDAGWIHHVITERANIELMLIDPHWARLDLTTAYPFAVFVLNVSQLIDGYHPSLTPERTNSPYHFARDQNLPLASLDDYVVVLDRLFAVAKSKGAICLKSARAYNRSLRFENVPKDRAARAFSRPRNELTPQEITDFQDYVMWRMVELAAKHDLPFQFHTGHGQLQGSNPVLLLNLIQGNPNTRFILFHGGYPWIGETGAIGLTHGRNVWIDSNWLATISPHLARRAWLEWLEVVPSNRLLWGGDSHNAEGIYGSTVVARDVLAEALAEKVERSELREEHALRIARQIMRDNALALFPSLRERLWKK